MNIRQCIFLSFVGLLLTGCFQEELPIDPQDRGGVVNASVVLQPDYRDQVWYSLEEERIVSVNPKTDWELGFLCADSTYGIILNSSLAMGAANTGNPDFKAVSSDEGLDFFPDHSAGHPDSMALRDILDGTVYIIDRGFNPSGASRGKVKFQLLSAENDRYTFQYAALSGENEHTITLEKDDRFNFLAWSLQSHEAKEIEPEKTSYDLCFTQYTHVFYSPYIPYLVTGVIQNRRQTLVAEDTLHLFEDMAEADLEGLSWSRDLDVIGYDWKYFDFNRGSFTVNPEDLFIIRNSTGYTFKLRFLDFYDESGNKGSPMFDFQRL